jgi:hypothetical protein
MGVLAVLITRFSTRLLRTVVRLILGKWSGLSLALALGLLVAAMLAHDFALHLEDCLMITLHDYMYCSLWILLVVATSGCNSNYWSERRTRRLPFDISSTSLFLELTSEELVVCKLLGARIETNKVFRYGKV